MKITNEEIREYYKFKKGLDEIEKSECSECKVIKDKYKKVKDDYFNNNAESEKIYEKVLTERSIELEPENKNATMFGVGMFSIEFIAIAIGSMVLKLMPTSLSIVFLLLGLFLGLSVIKCVINKRQILKVIGEMENENN